MAGNSCLKLFSRTLLTTPKSHIYQQIYKPHSFLKPVSAFTVHLKHSTSLKHFRVNPTVNVSLKQHFTQKVQPIDESITDEKVAPTKYNNWLDKLPPKLAPYVYLTRMDKPIGTWLLYWPCGEFR